MSSTGLAALHARLVALDANLDARLSDGSHALSPAAREALKAEIIALIREADREAAALLALKEDAKSLAAKWKRLPAPAPAPAPVVLTTRVDHLGASTYVAKGWTAISAGDYVRAEDALARALALAPEDLEAATLHGWSLMGQGRLDEALAVLQGVLARQPGHELARVNVGYVCLQKGIYGEAIEHLVRAARQVVDRKAALYANHYLGLVYLRREMYEDAAGFFRHALTLGPNFVEARYELGRALWFGGNHVSAAEAWREGASSGKFNVWSKRCAEVGAAVEQGGTPPAVGEARVLQPA